MSMNPSRSENGMLLDGDIGSKDEQRFQVLNVLFNALGFMAVGPGDNDILGMALFQSIPFLVAEHIEVEGVECLEVAFGSSGLRLVGRGRRGGRFRRRLRSGAN